MSAKTIFDRLTSAGMTETGAVATLCNMYAESGLKANIAQRGMTELTDEQYTAAADAGNINFVNDAVGYGLCQWTFWSRKRDLLQYADMRGVSVGDEDMQVEFCLLELRTDYPTVWNYLCSTNDLYTAVERVCREYERPAVNNVATRYGYAQTILSLISKDESDDRTASGLLTEDDAEATPTKGEAKKYHADMAVLTRGFYGTQVIVWQKMLEALGYLSVDHITGVYDYYTEEATKAYQEDHGLAPDGMPGPKTYNT